MFMDDIKGPLCRQSASPARDREDSTKSLPSNATIKKLVSLDALSSGSNLQQEIFATVRSLSPRLLSMEMDGKSSIIPMDLDGALDSKASCHELDSSLTNEFLGSPFICEHTVNDVTAQCDHCHGSRAHLTLNANHPIDGYPGSICWMDPFTRQQVSFYQLVVHEVDMNRTDMAIEKLSPWVFQIWSNSVELRNLTPNVEYLLRVRAVNPAGAGKWSKPYKFATLAAVGEGFPDPGLVTVTVWRKKDPRRKVMYLDRNGREGIYGSKYY